MNEYSVSDYGIFSSAIGTTTICNNITTAYDSVNEVKTVISNDSIFLGPIADVCNQELATLTLSADELKANFNTINEYLKTTSGNYQSSDKSASDAVLNLSGIGTSTTAASGTLGNTQATSFYDLGDRAYNGDTAAQQEWIQKVAKIVQNSQYSKYGLKNSLLIA